MDRVAVASRSFSRHRVLRRELTARYPDTRFNDSGVSLAGDELLEFLGDRDKAVIALEKITDDVLAALPALRVIAKYGVGFDMLDLEAMRARGVELGWAGGVNRRAVSELTICMAIDLLRHVARSDREVRSGGWQIRVGRQVSDCTVGIVGCGRVGQDLAILLSAFGCRIIAHDILDRDAFYTTHGIRGVGLEELLAEADVVTLHLPLDASTRMILDASRLALMKSDAVLINAARGGLVDESAVKAMLMDGRLGAAGFDVFFAEPPGDADLLALPNFLATAHMGGSSEEGILAMGRAAIAGLDEHKVPEPGVYPL